MSGYSTHRPCIEVLSLGGTIAMSAGSSGIVPRLGAAEIVDTAPGLAVFADLTTRTLRTVPSAHLVLSDVFDLAASVRSAFRSGADGVVVTQGTDTLEETAYALDLLLDTGKPVVVTGALRGVEALGADGPANLFAAVRVAADHGSRTRGVLAVLNDEVHLARWVTKTHTSRPDAFASRGAGPVGYVTEKRVRWLSPAPRVARSATPPPIGTFPSVLLIPTWMGDDGTLLRAALATDPAGIVVQGLGAGHLPPAAAEPLTEAAARIPVVLTSVVGAGEVHRSTYGYEGSESDLLARGLLWGGDLSGRKSRILLTIALAAKWPLSQLVSTLAGNEIRSE